MSLAAEGERRLLGLIIHSLEYQMMHLDFVSKVETVGRVLSRAGSDPLEVVRGMSWSKEWSPDWRTRKEADVMKQTRCPEPCNGSGTLLRAQGAHCVDLVVGCEVQETGELKALPLSALVVWRSQRGGHKWGDPGREGRMGRCLED